MENNQKTSESELNRMLINSEQNRMRLLNSFKLRPIYSKPILPSINKLNINKVISQKAQFYPVSPIKVPNLQSIIFKAVQNISVDIAKKSRNEFFLKEIKPILEEKANIMFNNGWWFVLSLPSDFFEVELGNMKNDEITEELLTKEIVTYFNNDNCKELEAVVKGWDLNVFECNKEIFQDALWAHKEGKFTLTVPALTIQVEGVIRSYLDHVSKYSFKKYHKELKRKYSECISEDDGMSSFIELQNSIFLKETLNNFFKSFDPSAKEFDDIYRNPMCHGQYLNYYSVGMSTKLFLFLDMIHIILEDLERYNRRF